jgi:uncharacterized protein (TIGR04222 family)
MGGPGFSATLAADHHTWGISGPDFLRIFLAALVLAVVITLVLRSRAWRWQAQRPVQRPVEGADLAPVELAYLTGEADHVVLVSCLRLAEAGAVEMPEDPYGPRPPQAVAEQARTAEVRVTGQPPTGRLHPVESATLRHLQAGRTGSELQATLRESPEMQGLHQDMLASGLLVDRTLARRLRMSGVALAAVVAVGVVRLVAGLANNRPVGFLVLALIGGAVALLLSLRVPRLTKVGTRCTEDYRHRYLDVTRPLMRNSPPTAHDTALAGQSPAGPRPEQHVDSWAIAALGAGAMWGLAPGAAAHFGFLPVAAPAGDGGAAAGYTDFGSSNDSGGSSNSSCGGGDSGGSSCGSSCGGGGCGGGGCGG